MPLLSGERNVHHHGLLAGLSAGTAVVLVCGVLILGVWHRVSGTVATAVTVMLVALVAVFLAAALYAVTFLFLRARHHVAHPETLTRHQVRAEVIPGTVADSDSTAVPAAPPAPPIAPVVHNHTWYLPEDPAAVAAAIRAIADGTTERT